MKLVARITVGAVASTALFVGVCFGFYLSKQPINLPYFDEGDASWSSFYTRFYMGGVPRDLEGFQEQEPWLLASLASRHEGRGMSIEERIYSQLQEMSGANVVLDIEAGGGRALVVSGDLKGRFRCLAIKHRSDNGEYDLVDSSGLVVHTVADVIANQCRQTGKLSVQKASFFDFMFYDLFRCFSACSAKEGVVFGDRVSDTKKNRFVQSIRARLASDGKEIGAVNRAPDDIQVDVKSVITSNHECFVSFVYVDPSRERVHKFAHFECDNEELIKLGELGYADGVSYYFFTLWPSFE